jgi:DNA-binding GntR family transcriptional regulator
LLRENDLAAEFGVSRTPIREVLQRLALEGLVESKNGVGTIVTALDYRKIKDVYEMRLRIAPLIGDLSPNGVEPRHIKRVESLLDRARRLVRAFDIKAYWQINHDLHFLIGELIGNSALRVMWDHFYFQAARMWYELARDLGREVSRSLIREIEDVLEAARDRDVRAIGYIQRNYIAYGLRQVVAHYEKTASGDPPE